MAKGKEGTRNGFKRSSTTGYAKGGEGEYEGGEGEAQGEGEAEG